MARRMPYSAAYIDKSIPNYNVSFSTGSEVQTIAEASTLSVESGRHCALSSHRICRAIFPEKMLAYFD